MALLPNFTKILHPNTDSNSFPVLLKYEKFDLQFWSGFALTFGHCKLYNRIIISRISFKKKGGRIYNSELHTVGIIYQNRNTYF